jgi:hypothetical protein
MSKKKEKEAQKTEEPQGMAGKCGEMMSGGLPDCCGEMIQRQTSGETAGCCGPEMREMMSRMMAGFQAKAET